jgi:hypothetical protein
MGQTGCIYRVEATGSLPEALRDRLPPCLFIAGEIDATESSPQAALVGYPFADPSRPVSLVTANGSLHARFRIKDSIEATLLEKYYDRQHPALTMRLPFNYSRLPNWVKGIGGAVLGSGAPPQRIPFPPDAPSYAVEWLRSLASTLCEPADDNAVRGWPFGKRAAACITHDVDTGWLFQNPEWLERLLAVEGKHGFHGGWYCVPKYSEDRVSEKGIERLLALNCEVGVHGYNHDAKLPLKSGEQLQSRLKTIREFAARWDARGFRSEWLFYHAAFLRELAKIFHYDSSAPASLRGHHPRVGTGCSSCQPFRTHGGMVELPLSLPMDVARHEYRESNETSGCGKSRERGASSSRAG